MFVFPTCSKKNLNALCFIVSHIQRIGCQPEKTTLHGGQSRSWSAELGKKNKTEKVWQRTASPTLLVVRWDFPLRACVRVCVLSSHLFCTSGLWTYQPGSHRGKVKGFLHLPSAVLALIFLARRIKPFLSLVDREIGFLCTH